jgi:hypothetical protein
MRNQVVSKEEGSKALVGVRKGYDIKGGMKEQTKMSARKIAVLAFELSSG